MAELSAVTAYPELELVLDDEIVTLDKLPLDVTLRIASSLCARSLVAYAECTSPSIAAAHRGYLGPMWAALHSAEVDSAVDPHPDEPCVPALEPQPSVLPPRPLVTRLLFFRRGRRCCQSCTKKDSTKKDSFGWRRFVQLWQTKDEGACKAAYLHAMAAVQRRCPRCGRQSECAGERLQEKLKEEPLVNDDQTQRHLPEFFSPRARE